MAGDWIKMRVDLFDDPAVVRIATQTGLDEDAVVGKLHRLWSWADRHTIDGSTNGITSQWVDRFLNFKGFANAMICAEWLAIDGDKILFPGFEKHNGASAKKRCDDQLRQRLSRKNRDEGVTGVSRDCIPRPFVRNVLSRDNYQCVYCGRQSSEESENGKRTSVLSIDHIRPNTRGGKTAIENLVTCCKQCNNKKNDRTPDEWGIEPTFFQDGIKYDKESHTIVTQKRDDSVTREEKRREEKRREIDRGKPRKRFIPPTLEEVTAYCLDRKTGVNPRKFIDHYEARGWMLGKNKMKDWQAAVRTWESNDYGNGKPQPQGSIDGI